MNKDTNTPRGSIGDSTQDCAHDLIGNPAGDVWCTKCDYSQPCDAGPSCADVAGNLSVAIRTLNNMTHVAPATMSPGFTEVLRQLRIVQDGLCGTEADKHDSDRNFSENPSARTDAVLLAVAKERLRQEQLRRDGKFRHTAASLTLGHGAKLAILTEEVGEVARAMNDEEGSLALYDELVQVAACAVAWAEALAEDARQVADIAMGKAVTRG